MSEIIDAFKEKRRDNIVKQGQNKKLWKDTLNWICETSENSYTYNFEWLGRPIIQFPQDMIAIQEILWDVKPDLVIETGIAHGGSLMLSASILALLDLFDYQSGINKDINQPQRKVLGIDIDIRNHNRTEIEKHPLANRITMIEGSSISTTTISQVVAIAKNYKKVLIILDSNHTHAHVLAELNAYAPLVSKGSYCVVFDTLIEDVPSDHFDDRPWGKNNNPKTAVWEYLKTTDRFLIDKVIENKLLITVAPDGYLKCIKD